MKRQILLLVVFSYPIYSTIYAQVDTSRRILEDLNKRILFKQTQNSFVRYDFKFSDFDEDGKRTNSVTGHVEILKDKNNSKYIIQYKKDGKSIIYDTKEILVIDTKNKNYFKLTNSNKNFQTIRFKYMTGLLENFRVNSALSYIKRDSCSFEGLLKHKQKTLFKIKHIYNPLLIKLTETEYIDTVTLFTNQIDYEFKVDDNKTVKNRLELFNISFTEPTYEVFNVTNYPRNYRQVEFPEKNDNQKGLIIGTLPPFLTGKDLKTNKVYNIKTDKITIIDFWFIKCYPCKEVNAALKRLQSKYEKKGLTIIGVNKIDTEKAIKKYLVESKTNYLTIKVEKNIIDDFKISAYPTIVFIDNSGHIKDIIIGSENDIEKKLEKLILKELDK